MTGPARPEPPTPGSRLEPGVDDGLHTPQDDAAAELVAGGLLGRIQAVRDWASAPSRRNLVYVVALALFVGTSWAAWRALPEDRGDLDVVGMVVASTLVIPGLVVNAEEYRVSAAIVGHRVPMRRAVRVALVATAFNLLPIPGSVLVRTGALKQAGSSTGRAVLSTAAVGLVYVGVALVLVAAVLGTDAGLALAALPAAGLGLLGAAFLLVRRIDAARAWRLLGWAAAVEAASVLVKAARLLLVVNALGFELSFDQAASLSLSTVVASAVGIFPGGLGLREVIAAAIAPAVDLPVSVGLLGTSVERVVALTALSVVGVFVLALTREPTAAPVDER